jgi:hypothetical protein
MVKGRKLQPAGGIYSQGRETSERQHARALASVGQRLAGPAAPSARIDVRESPIPGSLTGGPQSAFEPVA